MQTHNEVYKEQESPKSGWITPLHSAALYGRLEVFKLLLEESDDKNPIDLYGRTPAFYAVQNHHYRLSIYRVSHQYGNTFNFNFLILNLCYWKSKTCFEKFRSKPSRGHLDFDFFQKIWLFFRVRKKRNKTEFLFGSMPPSFFQNVPRFCFHSCTQVHESEKTKSWDI